MADNYSYNSASEHELDWDSTIQHDSADFVLLPPGEYPFTVIGFERGRHNGSEKLPPCNKAIITIDVDGGDVGHAQVITNLFLHSKCEGLLSSFFVSIGLKKKGEALQMGSYWNQLIGQTGRCRIKHYTKQSNRNAGETVTFNEVDRFLEPVETAAKGWTPGAF